MLMRFNRIGFTSAKEYLRSGTGSVLRFQHVEHCAIIGNSVVGGKNHDWCILQPYLIS